MYEGDSLFTLTYPQIAGLGLLSGLLCLLWLWLAWRIGARLPLWGALLAGLLLFYLFLWLSPQIYYTYYRMIIPGLPAQIVIKPPFGPGELLANLTFRAGHSIADHARGLLGWALIGVAFLHRRTNPD